MPYNEARTPGYYWVVWNRRYGKVIGLYSGEGFWTVGSRCLMEPDLPYIGLEKIEQPERLSINIHYNSARFSAGK